jgi:hypothetical protein
MHICSQSTVKPMDVIKSIPIIILYAASLLEVLSSKWACHVTTLLVLISGNLKSKRDSNLVVKVSHSVFHLVLLFLLARALSLPTNTLKILVDVVPVSNKSIMVTTVLSLFLISTIMSANIELVDFQEPLAAHVLV